MSEGAVNWIRDACAAALAHDLNEGEVIVCALNMACAMAYLFGLSVEDLHDVLDSEYVKTLEVMRDDMFEEKLDSDGLLGLLKSMVQDGRDVACISEGNLRTLLALGSVALVAALERLGLPAPAPAPEEPAVDVEVP